mmetsp:Transcript_134974/g.305501  ORF Transcript_134974/g.305501 Transcript_134974/m.305501 type:complete len:111 (+) Transcript_134974:69-401(+)
MRVIGLLFSTIAGIGVEVVPAGEVFVHEAAPEAGEAVDDAEPVELVEEEEFACRDGPNCAKFTRQFGKCKGKAARACKKSCKRCTARGNRNVFGGSRDVQSVQAAPATLR